MENDPILYLAIDNCFASKRWIRPAEWMKVISELGLTYIEASADTECDPLYMDPAFTEDWIRDVIRQSGVYGVRVLNVYSGHGTYATAGLSHYDARVTRRFRDLWMKRQMDTASRLGAGFGFFAHGFELKLLEDDKAYEQKLTELVGTLAELSEYADRTGLTSVSLEQMYSPHQPPWTIAGTRRLLSDIRKAGGKPFFITADVGHMNGQQFFLRPTADQITEALGGGRPMPWLGTSKAHALYSEALRGSVPAGTAVGRILEEVDTHPQLFSRPEDCHYENWLRELGCRAPIIHLQQTDGFSSPHWPFTAEYNAKGIIRPERVFHALKESFRREEEDMPPKVKEIALTLESFLGTAGNPYRLLEELRETVAYWRRFLPRDGMRLSEVTGC